MTKPTASPDPVALLVQAIDAMQEPDRTIAELDAMTTKLEAAAPDLQAKVAAGDVQAAAQLTCDRIRLKESIPAERAEADGRRVSTIKATYGETSNTITSIHELATGIVEQEKSRLDEAVLPLLLPLLLPGTTATVSDYASKTPHGQRATRLLRELDSISRDYLSCDASFIGPRSKPVEIDSARRQALRRANRVLEAWKEFTTEPANAN